MGRRTNWSLDQCAIGLSVRLSPNYGWDDITIGRTIEQNDRWDDRTTSGTYGYGHHSELWVARLQPGSNTLAKCHRGRLRRALAGSGGKVGRARAQGQ